MRQKVEIVPAAEADLPEILSLAKAAFPDPWTEQQFRQTMCCCYSRIWCARAAGEFCGYVAVSLAGDAVNLDDIAVAPAFRRQGIGRQLLDWAHRQFPENEFWLEVRESNAAAIALYESAGYRQVGFRKRYYRDPEEGAVLMTREVKKHDGTTNATEGFSALDIVACTSVCVDCTEFVEPFCGVQRQEKTGSQTVCRTFHGNWCGRVFSSVLCLV
ncbi:MAG: ribosomal protein S18-alanine N-acetyltransferase [Ruminococcus callidus]